VCVLALRCSWGGREKLARRLLFDKSANGDHERSILTKLKQQCGGQFTSKMEGMVRNMALHGSPSTWPCHGSPIAQRPRTAPVCTLVPPSQPHCCYCSPGSCGSRGEGAGWFLYSVLWCAGDGPDAGAGAADELRGVPGTSCRRGSTRASDLTVTVLTTGFWPSYSPPTLRCLRRWVPPLCRSPSAGPVHV